MRGHLEHTIIMYDYIFSNFFGVGEQNHSGQNTFLGSMRM